MTTSDELRKLKRREASLRSYYKDVESSRAKGRAKSARQRRADPERTRAASRASARKAYAADPQAGKDRSRAWQAANPARYFFRCSRKSAAKRGLAFDITREHVAELMAPMRCAATGLRLVWEGPSRRRSPVAPSLDRIDSARGYEPGNVRVVCYAYNTMKGSWTDEECLVIAKALVANASTSSSIYDRTRRGSRT